MYRRARGYREKGNSILVGYDTFLIIGIFSFVSFLPSVMTDIGGKLSLIGLSQILMLVIGLSAGFLINKSEIRIGFPDDDMVYKSIMFVIFGVVTLKILSMTTSMFSSAFEPSMEVVMMAAVAEESFFNLFLTVLFNKIFRYIIGNEMISMSMSLMFVGALFAVMHIGVYGTVMNVMIFLVIARIVMSLSLLYSRNFTVPILIHFIFNTLALL